MPIYFARISDDGPIKIGTTTDIDGRMMQLAHYYDRTMTILKVIPGGVEEERAIHARFAHLRYRKTEQFRPAPELMEFIDRPLFAAIDPDAVEVIEEAGRRGVRQELFTFRMTAEFRDYIYHIAGHYRVTAPTVLELGLVALANDAKLDPPPRR